MACASSKQIGYWTGVLLLALALPAGAQNPTPNSAAATGTPGPPQAQSVSGVRPAVNPGSPATSHAIGNSVSGSSQGTPPNAADTSTTDATPRNPAAKVNLVDGTVHTIGPDKVVRVPKAGDQLYEGDAIVTGDGAEIHLDMADGGFIAVRPNTQMRITKYQANGDESDTSVIGLLKGSLRSITGWIGKTYPRRYAVVTPSATIGVRGTDHEPAYVPEDVDGASAGTYDTVHSGKTSIANAHGSIDVLPGKAGFVDHQGLGRPRVLDRIPAFFAAPRRHDGAFEGKQERIAASLEQRRTARAQERHEELRRGPPNRAPGASLRTPGRVPLSGSPPAAGGALAGLRERLAQRRGAAGAAAEPQRGAATRTPVPARPLPPRDPQRRPAN